MENNQSRDDAFLDLMREVVRQINIELKQPRPFIIYDTLEGFDARKDHEVVLPKLIENG